MSGVNDHISDDFHLLVAASQEQDIRDADAARAKDRARARELRLAANQGLSMSELLEELLPEREPTPEEAVAALDKIDKDAADAVKDEEDDNEAFQDKFPAPVLTE